VEHHAIHSWVSGDGISTALRGKLASYHAED
jgi:hypothetical protein